MKNEDNIASPELREGAILESRLLPLADLVPNKGQIPDVPRNPRFIRDKRFKDLVKSVQDDPEMLSVNEIKVYPFKGKYVIIGGNMRYRALKELGKTETVCKIIPPTATARQLRAYVQKDNVSFGEYDMDALANEWDAQELIDWGLDISELAAPSVEEEAEEDDYDVDANTPEKPTAKPGDVYKLGGHRLVCGDSTTPEPYASLFDKETPAANLLLTDLHITSITRGARSKKRLPTTIWDERQFLQFLIDSMSKAAAVLRPGGAFYIWHSDQHGLTFRRAVEEAGLVLKQNLVWVKNSFVLGRQDYQWMHEPCLYGWKPGAAHYFVRKRSLSTVIDRPTGDEIEKMSKEQMAALLRTIYSLPQTVMRENKPRVSALHPTMKPVKLMGKLISNSTLPGEIVLDIFGGSGSTMIAAEQLGRRCFTIEYEPAYVDVIIKRWTELSGGQAKLIGNFSNQNK